MSLDEVPPRAMETALSTAATFAAEKLAERAVKSLTKSNKRRRPRRKQKQVKPKPKRTTTARRPKKQRTTRVLAPPTAVGVVSANLGYKKALVRHRGVDAIRLRGQEYLGSVVTFASAFYLTNTVPLNPLAFTGSRLAVESALWTKFVFNSVKFKYVPCVGTGTAGMLLMSHTEDPEIQIGDPGTLTLINALSSVKGSTSMPVWTLNTHEWKPRSTDNREFYISPDVDGENRLTTQGEFHMAQMTTGTASALVGQLYVEYDLTMYEAILSVTNLRAYTTAPLVKLNLLTDSPPTGTIGIYDGGATGALALKTPVSNAGFSWNYNQMIALYLNFSIGGVSAFKLYFTYTPANAAAQGPLYFYPTPEAAKGGSVNDQIFGSFGGYGSPPANGTMYYTYTIPTNPTLPPTLEDRLSMLENSFSALALNNDNARTPQPLVSSRERSMNPRLRHLGE